MEKILIAPSILAADLQNLKNDVLSVINLGADLIHVDIMDGAFVPQITFGTNMVKTLRKFTDIFLDVHLMIDNPTKHILSFAEAGANLITIHKESFTNDDDIFDALELIKSHNVKCGLSIKPNTPCDAITKFLEKLDLVLIMSVEPGLGGQKFIPSSLSKISYLKNQVNNLKSESNNKDFLIEVDGGINKETSLKCIEAGANVLVAGTYIFNAKDRKLAIEDIKHI